MPIEQAQAGDGRVGRGAVAGPQLGDESGQDAEQARLDGVEVEVAVAGFG